MAWPKTVRRSDLRIETFKAGGPGGQHRNKTESAVRITHLPTGEQGYAAEHRSQHKNRALAFRRLAEKLVPIMKREVQQKDKPVPTERVRTYHAVRNQVRDHRVPGRVWRFDDVVTGNKLAEIIEALAKETTDE